MRKFILVMALCVLGTARFAHAAHEIPMSAVQIGHLGITLVGVAPASAVMTGRMPARVVIPPGQERMVSSPVAGLVRALRVAVGDEVRAGQTLAIMESPELVTLQRDFLHASVESRLAKTNLTRDERLFNEGIIAERRFLTTRSRFEQAQSSLEESRQVLRLAGLGAADVTLLETSRTLSGSLTVTAPMSGTVLAQLAVVGQRQDKHSPLYRIGRLEPLWLEIRVPLDRLGNLRAGAEVSLPCESATAAVTVVGRNVDPGNQSVLVRAEVQRPAGCVRPGQFLEVRMALLSTDKLWRVPTSGLVRNGGNALVFARSAEGFRPQGVEVLGQDAGFSVVRADLRGDEQVAASGLAAIKAVWLGQGGAH